jgi:hypothetical protein
MLREHISILTRRSWIELIRSLEIGFNAGRPRRAAPTVRSVALDKLRRSCRGGKGVTVAVVHFGLTDVHFRLA